MYGVSHSAPIPAVSTVSSAQPKKLRSRQNRSPLRPSMSALERSMASDGAMVGFSAMMYVAIE